jgi:methionyl-tRNA formyltransferase
VAQRTVFLGTSGFAAEVLRALAASPHRPGLVVTPPDRRRGRGQRLASPPAADAARDLGLELLQAEDVNAPAAVDRIGSAAPDAGVVCAFGQLIREPLLSGLELLNVHPSLLPRWRGAAPIERALMAGDPETGITIMLLTEGLDSGPVALQERIAIERTDDHGSLEARLARLGGRLIVRALDLRDAGELDWVDQDDAAATYADKIAGEDRRLDPARPAAELERTVRALTPHVGAYLELEGDARLGVREAAARAGEIAAGRIEEREGELLLGTNDGVLRLTRVRPPGGREMSADAYLRGHGPPRLAA